MLRGVDVKDSTTRKGGTVTGAIDPGQLDRAGTFTVRDHHAASASSGTTSVLACPKAVSWVGRLLMGGPLRWKARVS